MENKKLNYIATLLLVMVFLGSCSGWKKMVDRANEVTKTVTPDPLEMHNEKVSVKLTVAFPTEYFHKKAIVTATPILKYNGQEKELPSVSFGGESVTENTDHIVSFANGGSFNYQTEFAYEDAMRNATLEIRLSGSMKGKPFEFSDGSYDQVIAHGVVTTPRLVEQGLAVDEANDISRSMLFSASLPPRDDTKFTATILYDIQRSVIKSTELSKAEFTTFLKNIENAAKDGLQFKGLNIFSYASPDGAEQLNKNLANDRSAAAKKYILEQLKNYNVVGYDNATLHDIKAEQEDWAGFQRLMTQSTISDKDLILRVVQMEQNLQKREEEIKKISATYTQIADVILPKLRRSEISITFKAKALTDEQILNYAKTDASKLTDVECLYAASLTQNVADQKKIYENFSKQYPQDWRGPNNLGVLALREGSLDDAKQYCTDAKALNNNGTVLNNLGVVALTEYFINRNESDLTAAEEYFTNAASSASSEEINYNLGVINIIKGNYSAAVTYFNSITCGFNPSLAVLLNGDNTAAKKKLDCLPVKDQAAAYYLFAVIGARNENSNECFTNLRQAVTKDASLKDYAKNDMEFIKFFEDATFKSIVQ